MTEIYNISKQDEAYTELIVEHLAMRESPIIQYIHLACHDCKGLARKAMFNFNLGTLKKFAVVGMRMSEITYNRLLVEFIARVKSGDMGIDFVDALIEKWETLVYVCDK